MAAGVSPSIVPAPRRRGPPGRCPNPCPVALMAVSARVARGAACMNADLVIASLQIQIWAFGAPSGQLGLPGADVGDQVQGAPDGGEGGACVCPGAARVIERGHPAADAP